MLNPLPAQVSFQFFHLSPILLILLTGTLVQSVWSSGILVGWILLENKNYTAHGPGLTITRYVRLELFLNCLI